MYTFSKITSKLIEGIEMYFYISKKYISKINVNRVLTLYRLCTLRKMASSIEKTHVTSSNCHETIKKCFYTSITRFKC
jgi:lipoprotein NlpI